jgi:hypothetical protein
VSFSDDEYVNHRSKPAIILSLNSSRALNLLKPTLEPAFDHQTALNITENKLRFV